MAKVVASMTITPLQVDKCHLYRINRSKIARAALQAEIDRFEKENGIVSGEVIQL